MHAFHKLLISIAVAIGLMAFETTSHGALSDGLISYWTFDGDTAPTATDQSGLGKDLSLMGDATINAGSGLIGDGLQFPTNEPGDTGRAGVNGWAQRPGDDDDYDFGASDYTIQTWINYSDTSDESSIIEKFGGSGDGWATTSFPQNSGFQLFHNAADGRLLRNDSHGVAPIPGWPNPTGWQHIVTLRRGDDLEIYANGSVVASANIVTDLGGSAGEPVTDNSLPLVLGYRADPADPRGFALNGSFDEVAIWTRALESEEITTLYNSGAGNPIDVMQITEVSWQNDVSGDWNATGNWSPGIVPDATNITAILGDAIQSTQTVFTNTDVTVQAMHFDNTNSYVVAGGGSMTFDSGTTAPQSDVNVFAGDHQFQAVVNLNNQTDLTIVSDASLAFINILNLDGNTLTKSGPGTLSVNNNLVAGVGGTVNCEEGICSGTGTIGGDLNNNGGTISPGSSPGILTVDGTQSAAVPEPGSLLLLVFGSVSALACRCRA